MRFSTKAVHGGVKKDDTFNSVITPLYPSSTFYFDKIGHNKGYDYTRSGNPTRKALEENIAGLEGGCRAFCTSTGMSAEAGVLHLLKPGDHVVAGSDIYGGTYRLMDTVFRRMGVNFTFTDMTDSAAVSAAISPATKMIWVETPSNPLLNITDIRAVAFIAKSKHILLVADNTFLSPYFQKPLELGADIVVHSTTKYLNGHSDVVGGCIVVKDEKTAEEVKFLINALGLGESPWDAWLVLRGIKTLPQRMKAHQENALAVAKFLEQHKFVLKVWYPGLESHPQYDLITKQMSGFGGIVSFELDAAKVPLDTFFGRLELYSLAESLGGVESLIESPWYMSHASMPETARIKAGLNPNIIRISVGIEDSGDLINDLEQALNL